MYSNSIFLLDLDPAPSPECTKRDADLSANLKRHLHSTFSRHCIPPISPSHSNPFRSPSIFSHHSLIARERPRSSNSFGGGFPAVSGKEETCPLSDPLHYTHKYFFVCRAATALVGREGLRRDYVQGQSHKSRTADQSESWPMWCIASISRTDSGCCGPSRTAFVLSAPRLLRIAEPPGWSSM